MGPVIDARAAARLEAAYDAMVAAGGHPIRRLARLPQGAAFVSPGLIDTTGVDLPDEEHFGPLLRLIRVPDWDSAMREANATRFGLAAALVGGDAALYERFWTAEPRGHRQLEPAHLGRGIERALRRHRRERQPPPRRLLRRRLLRLACRQRRDRPARCRNQGRPARVKRAALALLLVLPCAAGEVAAQPTKGAALSLSRASGGGARRAEGVPGVETPSAPFGGTSPALRERGLPDILHGTPGPELAGLAIIVADRTRILRAEAHGSAVLDPDRPRALTPDTPVRVASISKLVVALTAWTLIEQGKLAPDADVSAYLGWPLRNPAHPETAITLRQLLSHTSGIDDGPGYSFPRSATLRASLTPQHWSAAAPGVRFSYANLNYGIVATILEAVTHTRFDRLARSQILAPLHLDACYNWSGCSPQAIASAAVLYRRGKDETAWNPAGPWVAQVDDLHGIAPACPVRGEAACDLAAYVPGINGTLFSPQGGLRISARGLATLGRLILNRGEVDGVRLLRPATIDAMLAPVWRDMGQPSGDTYKGLMRLYASGPQLLSGEAGARDQPVDGRAVAWAGHLGEAYGLLGGLWVDRARGRVYVYLITGLGDDPARYPGRRSAFSATEEAVLSEIAKFD